MIMAHRHKLYEYDYKTGKIVLKRKLCPRCGRVMAFHGDRHACGYCGYTIYVKEEEGS